MLAAPAVRPATLTIIETQEGHGPAVTEVQGSVLGAIALIGFAAAAAASTAKLPLAAALLGAFADIGGCRHRLVPGADRRPAYPGNETSVTWPGGAVGRPGSPQQGTVIRVPPFCSRGTDSAAQAVPATCRSPFAR
jgi:hypothetical protein